jgi:hypothetical protein
MTGPIGYTGPAGSSNSSSLQNVKTINSTTLDGYKINMVVYDSNQIIKSSDLNIKGTSFNMFNNEYQIGPSIQTKYVAVGKDGSTITGKSINYSNNGTNWISCKSPFDASGGVCNSVAYNGSIWVAVGTNTLPNIASTTTIAYSFNGTTWTPANGKTFNGIGGQGFGVYWGKDKFVAAGCDSSSNPTTTIVYSYNGINWLSALNNPFGTTATAKAMCVCNNGSMWVVGGTNGYVGTTYASYVGLAYSYNGSNWIPVYGNQITAGFAINTVPPAKSTALRSVIWTGKRFFLTGIDGPPNTNFCLTSMDGVNWFGARNPHTSSYFTYSVATNGKIYVANGHGYNHSPGVFSVINTSLDAYSWSAVSAVNHPNIYNSVSGLGQNNTLGGYVYWSGTRFFALGGNISTAGSSVISYDGFRWESTITNIFSTTGNAVGLGMTSNCITRSNKITIPANILVNGGLYNSATNPHTPTLNYSLNNGTSWTVCKGELFGTNGAATCVAYNGRIWLAGGYNTASTTSTISLVYSLNGIYWSQVPNSTNYFSYVVYGIAWSPTLKVWMATGQSSSSNSVTAYSYDGLTWTNVSSLVPFTGTGFCVAWGQDKFVIGGNSSGNKLYYSYNGKTWNSCTTPTITEYISAIAFNGTMWVAVGNNNPNSSVFYSYDGITWTITPTANVFNQDTTGRGAVGWSPSINRWVASRVHSTANLYYSDDGINWTVSTFIANTVQSICWCGNSFLIGLTGVTTSISSYDGINFSNIGTSIQTFAYAWSQCLPNSDTTLSNVSIQHPTLAFGSGTNNIAYSNDDINWKGLGTGAFTASGICNGGCWNGTLWVAGGSTSVDASGNGNGTGVMVYSYDGITWTTITQSILTVTVNDIEWNGTVFVAVGQGSTYCMAYSTDGITWLPVTETSSTLELTTAYCVTWGQNYFVLGGKGTKDMAYSTDGITWTSFNVSGTSEIHDIQCGASLWVLCGLSTDSKPITYSATNPSLVTGTGSWTLGSGLPNITGCFNTLSFGIIYDTSVNNIDGTIHGTTFCLGGWSLNGSTASALCYYSINGTAWTTVDASSVATFGTTPINSITWNGNRFLASGGGLVGDSNRTSKMSYSYDGRTWYGYVGPTPASQFFTSSLNGSATNPNTLTMLGSVYVDSAFTLKDPFNSNIYNQLELYGMPSVDDVNVSIKSTPI